MYNRAKTNIPYVSYFFNFSMQLHVGCWRKEIIGFLSFFLLFIKIWFFDVIHCSLLIARASTFFMPYSLLCGSKSPSCLTLFVLFSSQDFLPSLCHIHFYVEALATKISSCLILSLLHGYFFHVLVHDQLHPLGFFVVGYYFLHFIRYYL